MTRRLPEIFEDMRLALLGRKSDHSWKGAAGDAYNAAVGEIKEFSGDTLGKAVQQFNDALPYIERAGYEVTEVEVGLGITPKIAPHLKLRELIDDETRAELLTETSEKKLVHTVLRSLFKASDTRRTLKFKRFHFSEIELELGLLPGIVLKFRPDELGNLSHGDDNVEETLPVPTDEQAE